MRLFADGCMRPDRRFLQVCFFAQTQDFVRAAREFDEFFRPLPLVSHSQ